MICFSGCSQHLVQAGSRSSSSAARSKRDIIASNGFSSLRNRSLSGPITDWPVPAVGGGLMSVIGSHRTAGAVVGGGRVRMIGSRPTRGSVQNRAALVPS